MEHHESNDAAKMARFGILFCSNYRFFFEIFSPNLKKKTKKKKLGKFFRYQVRVSNPFSDLILKFRVKKILFFSFTATDSFFDSFKNPETISEKHVNFGYPNIEDLQGVSAKTI